MTYAIAEISGKQMWVEPGYFYDVNKIKGSPGDTIILKRILLYKDNNKVNIGNPCLKNIYIRTKIIKHLKNRKITIFKMKSKKNMKLKKGYRQNCTRLLIQQICN